MRVVELFMVLGLGWLDELCLSKAMEGGNKLVDEMVIGRGEGEGRRGRWGTTGQS